MAATNYTPIQLYYSTTASAAPSAGNLTSGELAINITDGKLYYKDNAGNVQVIATKGAGTIGGSNTQIQYNNNGALAGNAAMTFNSGTNTVTLTTLNLTNALGATYGGTAQSSYTQGDILYSSASNTLSKLGIGTVNYILTSTGSVPQWSAPSSITVQTATNLAGGAAGSVPYQSAPDTTTFLSIGAANRVMTSSGTAPQWVTALTGLTGVSSSSITNTSLTATRLVYSSTAGLQTDSANLTFDGTTLSAAGYSTTGLSTLVKTVTIGNSNFNGTAVFAAATPAKLYIGTGTVTDTTSAIGATNATGAISSLAITPIAASNTSVTYTNASTLYIAGAPSAGTNVTITNPWSTYVAAGNSYYGGNIGVGTYTSGQGYIQSITNGGRRFNVGPGSRSNVELQVAASEGGWEMLYGVSNNANSLLGGLVTAGTSQALDFLSLRVGSTDVYIANSTTAQIGRNLVATTDATYDIGLSGANRFRNLYLSGSATLGGGTANGVLYLNGSKVTSANAYLRYDGTGLLSLGDGNAPAAWLSATSSNIFQVGAGSVSFEGNAATTTFGQYAYQTTINNTTGWNVTQLNVVPWQYQLQNGFGHVWRVGTTGAAGSAVTWTTQMSLDGNNALNVNSGSVNVSGSGGRGVTLDGAGGNVKVAGDGTTYAMGLTFFNNYSSLTTPMTGIFAYGAGGVYQFMSIGGSAYNNGAIYIPSSKFVGINEQSPTTLLSLASGTATTLGMSITPSGWNNAKHRFTVPTSGDTSVWSYNWNGSTYDFNGYGTSSIYMGQNYIGFYTGTTTGVQPTRRGYFDSTSFVIDNSNFSFSKDYGGASASGIGSFASNANTLSFYLDLTGGAYNSLTTLHDAAIFGINTTPDYGLTIGKHNGAAIRFGGNADATVQFGRTGGENARFTSAGYFWVNATSAPSWYTNPLVQLGGDRPIIFDTNGGTVGMKGSSGGWGMGNQVYGQAGTYRGGFGYLGSADTLSYYWVGTAYNGTGVQLNYGGTSWSSLSDIRDKNVHGVIENALQKLAGIRSVYYNYKKDAADKSRRVGFIAQEVNAVLPEAVEDVQREINEDASDETRRLVLSYTDVIPLIAAAVNELKAEFDAYRAAHP